MHQVAEACSLEKLILDIDQQIDASVSPKHFCLFLHTLNPHLSRPLCGIKLLFAVVI